MLYGGTEKFPSGGGVPEGRGGLLRKPQRREEARRDEFLPRAQASRLLVPSFNAFAILNAPAAGTAALRCLRSASSQIKKIKNLSQKSA
jgi:hypothetical protein